MVNFLPGLKTYIVAAGIVLTAFIAWYNGAIDLGTAFQQALTGLGLAALRNGVAQDA